MKTTPILLCALLVATGCKKTEEYDATGIFETTTTTLSAETNGKILRLPVEEGDTIAAGQLVALIDTTNLSLQIEQLGSRQRGTEVTAPDIQAQAAALRTRIAHQKNECERINRLLADGAATQKQKDDAEASLKALNAELAALISTLSKNKSSIGDNASALSIQSRQVADQIDKCHVTTPISGCVLVKYAEPGEFATAGRPLVKIADMEDIYLRSYFTVSQLADIKVGQKVTVIADYGEDKQYEYPGTITWIAEESQFTPKSIQTPDSRANLVYAVKIAVKNDGRLKLGQYGGVRL